MQKQAVGAFLKRYGWPILGFLAAAPVIAHGLDWKSRTLAKQKLKAERIRKAEEQLAKARGIVPEQPTGLDAYKAAAYKRELMKSSSRSATEKLDMLDRVIKKSRGL